MKAYLLSIGASAEVALSTIFASFYTNAAKSPESLSVLHLGRDLRGNILYPLLDDLNRTAALLSSTSVPFCKCTFTLSYENPSLPDTADTLADTPAAGQLLDALRGKGMPLSVQTDREAAEWASIRWFDGIEERKDSPASTWLKAIHSDLESGETVRLALLADISDPRSAGALAAALRFFDHAFTGQDLSPTPILLAKKAKDPEDRAALCAFLRSLEQPLSSRAFRLLSLPASQAVSPEAWRLVYLSAARYLGAFYADDLPAEPGCTRSVPAPATLSSLETEAVPLCAFVWASVWLLGDLLPAAAARLDRTGRLSSLAGAARSPVMRKHFASEDPSGSLKEDLATLTRTLRALLIEILSLLRFLPSALRLSGASGEAWDRAVSACGSFVTLAAELDVSRAEAEVSGIDKVMPVHRESMADTEEEQLQRRLDNMADQVDREEARRSEIFAELGAFRALQALRDCLSKCQSAKDAAAEKLRLLAENPDTERLQLAFQERRVRLLAAAVARCEKDLNEISRPGSLAGAPANQPESSGLFADMILSPRVEELLWSALPSSGSALPEDARKKLRDLLPELFRSFPLADLKTLNKDLAALPALTEQEAPLQHLIADVVGLCEDHLSALRFPSEESTVPPLPLLPDLDPGDASVDSVAELLSLFHEAQTADPAGDLRGLLALLVLRPYRRLHNGEASLRVDELRAEDGAFVASWLAPRDADRVRILSLAKEDTTLPFAMVLPGKAFLPARRTAAHASLIPDWAVWYDEVSSAFRDPIPFLTQRDRALLKGQLSRLQNDLNPLPEALSAFLRDLSEDSGIPDKDSAFTVRLRAVCGLKALPAYKDSLLRLENAYEQQLEKDEALSCFLPEGKIPAAVCETEPEILYTYRNVPFARESATALLESVRTGEEETYILDLLRKESASLLRSSDDYRDALTAEIPRLLSRYPLVDSVRKEEAERVLNEASEPVPEEAAAFDWPWDPLLPSVRTVFSECLGDTLAAAAVSPFSDKLLIFPARGGDVIGDHFLSTMCTVPPLYPNAPADDPSAAPAPDTVLPPLSPRFAEALSTLPEGRTLLQPAFLRFERLEGNAVRVTMILEGAFTLKLTRTYAEDDLIPVYAHDMPTLAVWPSLPFSRELWKTWFVYGHLPSFLRVSLLLESGEVPLSGDTERKVARTDAFPLCFLFTAGEDVSAGALPNLLPVPEPLEGEAVTACVDFGSSASSVVLSEGHHCRPLQGPVMIRTLLQHPALSAELLRREFLPSVPVSALIPMASRIFRNVPGAAPAPLEDGMILMSANLPDVLSVPSDALYTGLKWEDEKGRASSLCLHQLMLITALQARSEGAPTLSWRFALPDEMALEGRRNLANLLTSLAESVAEESGYDAGEEPVSVTFASESSALGAYFRFCSPEDTRGGFMCLDLGSTTADISLFLRGREQAVRTCQLPLGLHYMLLPALLRHPELLLRDFSFVPDSGFQQDLNMLVQIIRNAASDSASLRHARLALDTFISDRHTALHAALMQRAADNAPGVTGALLLLYLSYLMMLSGLVLLQLAADPNRNDFLPEQMTLCLSGRGALLLEMLSERTRTSLWHFLTMFRNPRVASISLLFSAEKKMEIPVGLSLLENLTGDLPPSAAVPASIAVRPEELLPEFLNRFLKEFPAEAALLFPGYYTGDFYHPFTAYGESMITAAMDAAFADRDSMRPYDALSGWISDLVNTIFDSNR